MNFDRFHFSVGAFDCLAINDGGFVGRSDMLFVNAPSNELEQMLLSYDLKPDHLPSTWTCLLVNTPQKTVLIDTGSGGGSGGGSNTWSYHWAYGS